jgi:HD-GYP domain-containing protein (c-di-GMP phosphodiesterase class II)
MINPLDFFRSAKRVKDEADGAAESAGQETRLRPGENPAEEKGEVFPPPDPVAAPPIVEPVGGGLPETPTPAKRAVEVAAPVAAHTADGGPSGEEIYRDVLTALQQFFVAAGRLTSADKEGTLSIGDLQRASQRIVDRMAEGDDLIAIAVGPYPSLDRFVLYHSVNVAILSQRVARVLDMERSELEVLCLAALAHDVGTVRVPAAVFTKAESLSPDEWEIMRLRPVHSHEILLTLGAEYRAITEIAHQAYERLDGSGYPRQLNVDGVSLEASIIGAVDLFEAIIHPRPYKKTVPAAAMYGVDNMMRMSNQFGDGVLKALVRGVGLFPVGTFVRLNSGEVARVSKSRQANPMRPAVEVLWDTQKHALKKPKLLDLMQAPHLYVYRPLSTEDLRELGLQI